MKERLSLENFANSNILIDIEKLLSQQNLCVLKTKVSPLQWFLKIFYTILFAKLQELKKTSTTFHRLWKRTNTFYTDNDSTVTSYRDDNKNYSPVIHARDNRVQVRNKKARFWFFTLQRHKRSANTLTLQRNSLPRSLRFKRHEKRNYKSNINRVNQNRDFDKKTFWRNLDRFLWLITYRWWRDVPWWQTVLFLRWVYAWCGTGRSCIRPRARHRECEAHRTAAPGISHLFVCHRVDTGSKSTQIISCGVDSTTGRQLSNQG